MLLEDVQAKIESRRLMEDVEAQIESRKLRAVSLSFNLAVAQSQGDLVQSGAEPSTPARLPREGCSLEEHCERNTSSKLPLKFDAQKKENFSTVHLLQILQVASPNSRCTSSSRSLASRASFVQHGSDADLDPVNWINSGHPPSSPHVAVFLREPCGSARPQPSERPFGAPSPGRPSTPRAPGRHQSHNFSSDRSPLTPRSVASLRKAFKKSGLDQLRRKTHNSGSSSDLASDLADLRDKDLSILKELKPIFMAYDTSVRRHSEQTQMILTARSSMLSPRSSSFSSVTVSGLRAINKLRRTASSYNDNSLTDSSVHDSRAMSYHGRENASNSRFKKFSGGYFNDK
jgi:hypothetical protein